MPQEARMILPTGVSDFLMLFRRRSMVSRRLMRPQMVRKQILETLAILLAGIQSVRTAVDRADFEHPLTQWALWIGGIGIPLLILVAVFI
jgi:hypothetical protein